MLVRGVDHYNHFKIDTPSSTIFDENAWNKQKDYEDLLYQTYDKMNQA
jgi:hypothetical protein